MPDVVSFVVPDEEGGPDWWVEYSHGAAIEMLESGRLDGWEEQLHAEAADYDDEAFSRHLVPLVIKMVYDEFGRLPDRLRIGSSCFLMPNRVVRLKGGRF